LGLALHDEVPDDTTICHFRTNRMGEENFDEFFNEIVRRRIQEKRKGESKKVSANSTEICRIP
jgi:hypothetical protein